MTIIVMIDDLRGGDVNEYSQQRCGKTIMAFQERPVLITLYDLNSGDTLTFTTYDRSDTRSYDVSCMFASQPAFMVCYLHY